MRKESLFAVIVCLMMVGAATAELPKYEIIDLDAAGETRTRPYAINDAGQIVGQCTPIIGYIDLSTIPGYEDADEQLRPDYGDCFGFIWDKVNGLVNMSELIDEGVGFNSIPTAYDINNNGQVIGVALKGRPDKIVPIDLHPNSKSLSDPEIIDAVEDFRDRMADHVLLPVIIWPNREIGVCFL